MTQKKTWWLYLIGGIFSLTLFNVNISCSQEERDCSMKSEFIYINNTDYQLEIPIGIILPQSNLSKKYDFLGSCNAIANDYLPPFRDVLKIRLDNNKCKTYTSSSLTEGEGPLVIANYISEKITKNNFRFIYTFNSEDFENVEDCN
ncbi:MAG: hypothetical protein ACPG8F_00970 [Flavobacteriaceae bacterium]